MWIVAQRFRLARGAVLEMNATLKDRVLQKEAELRESFARLAAVERAGAVLRERQRILRDMHDGVGAHLATAVRQLEGERASRAEVASSLRDSLMQLKLSIDAMSLPRGDVNALMASLRFRLESGIALEWDVEALPAWSATDGRIEDSMRELQFILLEAISNVLQHANASRLTISARKDPPGFEGFEIEVVDDGVGPGIALDTAPRSMRERAETIGVQLDIAAVDACGNGTRVRIRLPQSRVDASHST
jgi:signal transduction histidine kinase